ncbi:hypothetical protein ACS0TY_022669 [Phlomoides rotata]
MAHSAKQTLLDLSPLIKLYTDGTVDRLYPSTHVPPSPVDPTTGVSSKDVAISPAISARLHLPKLTHPSQTLPILVYFHGGAFCVESAFSLLGNRYTTLLSAASAAMVVSVEYRLAPEHPLPAAYDDSWTALSWICSHIVDEIEIDFQREEWITHHGDFGRIIIGGDSAGGNIAHNVAIRAGSDPLPGNLKIAGAILSHPYFWGSDPIGNESGENREESKYQRLWLLAYPSAGGGIDNPMINPLVDGAPRLSGLGCSRIMVCLSEKDVLTARGRVYAEEVRKSGWKGEVEVVEVEGEDHCFHYFDTETENARSLINRIAAFISR